MEYMYTLLTLLLMLIKMWRISKEGYWCNWRWYTMFYYVIPSNSNIWKQPNPPFINDLSPVCTNVTRARQQVCGAM